MPGAEAASAPESVRRATTLGALFSARVAATPQGAAYREFRAGAGWVETDWQAAGARVEQFAAALRLSNLPQGGRVAILMPNGLDAVCMDQAALALGLVTVPLHQQDNPASLAWILADAEASLLLLPSCAQWQAIVATGTALPALTHVIVADGGAQDASDPRVRPLLQWLDAPSGGAARMMLPRPGDVASIVYTSGTTGRPKGVMLTHDNVLSNVRAVLARVEARPSDVFLSFLPLSHTFERTVGYYLPIASGSCVTFARSVQHLADDLRFVRPTVLVSVPRIYERFHAALQDTLERSPARAWLFGQAEAAGWRRFCRRQNLPLNPADDTPLQAVVDTLAWPLFRRLAARPVLERFGGRVRVAVSGGAALSPTIAHCFLGLGLPVLQGYGLTETSPVVSANTLDDNDPATVGRALPGVELRLVEGDELQVRGPGVMSGYWKRPEDTRRVLSADGWFSTGDQARIEHGRVRIVGRIKDIIVTSTGEKVSPSDVELAITADPLFAQAFVTGENKPFLACVAVLDAAHWPRLAQEAGVPPEPVQPGHPAVVAAALRHVRAATEGLPYYAAPRALHLSVEPWTPDNGLLTPTLKLKRAPLAARFAADLARLYAR